MNKVETKAEQLAINPLDPSTARIGADLDGLQVKVKGLRELQSAGGRICPR